MSQLEGITGGVACREHNSENELEHMHILCMGFFST